MVWYSHLLKNFLQFIVIHTVKDFGIVNRAEIDEGELLVLTVEERKERKQDGQKEELDCDAVLMKVLADPTGNLVFIQT